MGPPDIIHKIYFGGSQILTSKALIFELPHDKTNKVACVPSKDSDPPSLIRVFTVCRKKAWVLSYPLDAQRRLLIR